MLTSKSSSTWKKIPILLSFARIHVTTSSFFLGPSNFVSTKSLPSPALFSSPYIHNCLHQMSAFFNLVFWTNLYKEKRKSSRDFISGVAPIGLFLQEQMGQWLPALFLKYIYFFTFRINHSRSQNL